MSITKLNASGRVHSIASLEDWYLYAPPKSPSHWREGRSAMELARAWLGNAGGSLPQEVAAALAAHPHFGPVLKWNAEPEARLHFDEFAGEPRNSDLLVVVEDCRGLYVLAVEGKADEPYGELVAKAYSNAEKRRALNPRSNGVARIERLLAALLPTDTDPSIVGRLRYQLLTACAGAAAEAHRRGLSRAVMLVHEFVTNATQDEKHQSNASDLAAFVTLQDPGAPPQFNDGALFGPFCYRPCGDVLLYVGKVSRSLRTDHL